MFMVSEDAAPAIRTTFEKEDEFSAAIELRRRFPGITDNKPPARPRLLILSPRPANPLG
jgi:hypothetical protein